MALVGHIVRETMARVPSHVDRDDLTLRGPGCPRAGRARLRPRAGRPVRAVRRDPDPRRDRGRAAQHRLGLALGPPARPRARRDPHQPRRRPRPPGHRRRGRAAPAASASRRSPPTTRTSRAPRCCRCTPRRTPRSARPWCPPRPAPRRWPSTPSGSPTSAEAIAELPERLRHVVEQYFLAERPMAEIAATLGVSESRVSQIRAEALVLLRDALNHELEPELVAPHAAPQRLRRPASRGLLRRRRRPPRRLAPPRHHHGPQRLGLTRPRRPVAC